MDKILSLISIAKKSGNVVSGEFSTENAIRDKKAFLVIIAEDASDNTKKKFKDKSAFYHVPCRLYGDKTGLGRAMGLKERACLAILDRGLSDAVIAQLNNRGEIYGENQNI